MTENEPYRLHHSLGYHLSLAARIQERRLDDGLKAFGLTRGSWCVLLAVGSEGLLQPSEIAAFVGIDRTAASRLLRQMETAGLLGRKSGHEDKRTTTVHLTARGRDVMERATPLAVKNNAIMTDRLGDEDADRLIALLQDLIRGEDKPLSSI